MKGIRFSRNWNNKLDCPVFSTVCRASSRWYHVDDICMIEQSENTFQARIINARKVRYAEITTEMALLDMGCGLHDFRIIMRRFYPDVTDDTLFYYLILRREK